MLSVNFNCFSSDERVYSDKLTIEIHQDDTAAEDASVNTHFDPDTLERHLDNKKPSVNNNDDRSKGNLTK